MKFKTRVLLVAGFAVVNLLVVLAISPLGKQIRYLWEQHQLANAILVPGTVLYTEDPGRISELEANQNYRLSWPVSPGSPQSLDRVGWVGGFRAHYKDKGRLVEGFQIQRNFGQLRVSKGGEEWIVLLNQVSAFAAEGGTRKVVVTQASYKPAGLRPRDYAVCRSFMSKATLLNQNDILTIFAPQLDPSDASKVTIGYVLNGKPGKITGELQSNGYVDFHVESGPLPQMQDTR